MQTVKQFNVRMIMIVAAFSCCGTACSSSDNKANGGVKSNEATEGGDQSGDGDTGDGDTGDGDTGDGDTGDGDTGDGDIGDGDTGDGDTGDGDTGDGDTGDGDKKPNDAATDGKVGDSGDNGPAHTDTACPASEPMTGAACTDTTGKACAYGDNPECRKLWVCGEAHVWMQIGLTGQACGGDSFCPASVPTGTCTQAEAKGVCSYAEGEVCQCSPANVKCSMPEPAQPDAPQRWFCSAGAPCPALGAGANRTCTAAQEGTTCTHEQDACTARSWKCTAGIWQAI